MLYKNIIFIISILFLGIFSSFHSWLIIIALSISNYSNIDQCSKEFSGEMNNAFLTKIQDFYKNKCSKYELSVSSFGGHEDVSLSISETISNHPTNLTIDRYCLSSCAEFLMPAASSVQFVNLPIVAVHGNPVLTQEVLLDNGVADLERCDFLAAKRMSRLYEKRDMSLSFWKLEKKILFPTKILKNNYQENCDGYSISYLYNAWLPNSIQLQKFMGLRFSGKLCSDTPKNCAKRAESIFGKNVVIGNMFPN